VHDARLHVLLLHAPLPLAYVQAKPHEPQLFGSYVVLVQLLPQTCWPVPHDAVQLPPAHAYPDAHLLPHVPQFD
jgi:hypothetical protein